MCEKSVKIIARTPAADREFFYPILYLNLGRARLAGHQTKAALEAFHDGLKYDTANEELLSHIRKIGIRRPPVITFLDRSNPLNKFLGKIRHRLMKN